MATSNHHWLVAAEAINLITQKVTFGNASNIFEDAIKRGGVKVIGHVLGEIAERIITSYELQKYELLGSTLCQHQEFTASRFSEQKDILGFRVERGTLTKYLREHYPPDQYYIPPGSDASELLEVSSPQPTHLDLVAYARKVKKDTKDKIPTQTDFGKWLRKIFLTKKLRVQQQLKH